jgi:hypothetical protein
MTPISPKAILFLMQSGWPADMILPIVVDSINGLRSRVGAGANQRLGDPDFYRKNITTEIATALRETNELLGLDPNRQETKVTYGLLPRNDQEIAMITRSTMQIMIYLASLINMPPEHVADGRTVPSVVPSEGAEEKIGQLIHVKSGIEKPEDAFTAVKYEGHWFWIDKRDFRSKRTFAFLMILFSLTETGGKEGLPLVTIPAG